MIQDMILLSGMGLPTIEENMLGIINHIREHASIPGGDYILTWSRTIAYCLALGVGSYECWMMMLGRRGLDVMKLLYIVIISLCITWSGTICEGLSAPCHALENVARLGIEDKKGAVDAAQAELAEKQSAYNNLLKSKLSKDATTKDAKDKSETQDEHWYDGIVSTVDEKINDFYNLVLGTILSVETTICEWISIIIRYIGEILFQCAFYGLLIAAEIFKGILRVFAPLMFAISLAPPFRSAWSQWISKYVSVSLWGFIVYCIYSYVLLIMQYCLEQDIAWYDELMGGSAIAELAGMELTPDQADQVPWDQVKTIGMQGLGTCVMYIVALIIGCFCLSFVPEVASWCIPGGISSGAGSMASTVNGASVGALGASKTYAQNTFSKSNIQSAAAKTFNSMPTGPLPSVGK